MVLISLGWTMSIVVDFPASVSTQLIGLKHQTNSQGPIPLASDGFGNGHVTWVLTNETKVQVC